MKSERPIYLSELFIFFRKQRPLILKIAAASFLATFLLIYFISTPQFRADATFRQARTSSEEAGSLQTLLLSIRLAPEETSAISVMHSRRVLTKVIEKSALQIESPNTVQFKNVHYDREIPLTLILHPTTATTFDILDEHKNKLARGTLNKPLLLDYYPLHRHQPSSQSDPLPPYP